MGSIVSCVSKKISKNFLPKSKQMKSKQMKSKQMKSKKKYKFIHTYKIHNQNSSCEKSFHNIQQNERTILYFIINI
jgi:hypothetical protein